MLFCGIHVGSRSINGRATDFVGIVIIVLVLSKASLLLRLKLQVVHLDDVYGGAVRGQPLTTADEFLA